MMKKCFLVIFLGVLFSSWIPYKGSPLYGQVPTPFGLSLHWKNFWERTNQSIVQNYVGENFGFRNDLVTLKNNLVYLYNGSQQPENRAFFLGKNDRLFDHNFFSSFFPDRREELDSIIKKNCEEIIKFSNFFKNFNIPVIVVMAPDKSLTYRNDLPFHYRFALDQSSKFYAPYEKYVSFLKEKGVTVIDGQKLSNEKVGDFPVFSSGGVHWTQAGASLIVKKIYEDLYGSSRSLNFEVLMSSKALNEEEDLRLLQNTTFLRAKKDEKYPLVVFSPPEELQKYYFWVYGDSFTNQLSVAIEKSGMAEDGESTFIHNRLLNNKNFAQILSHRSAVVICYTIPFFLSPRVGNDLKASLAQFSPFFCKEGCEEDSWIGSNAEILAFKDVSNNKLKFKLINAMPSVTSFQIELNNSYVAKYVISNSKKTVPTQFGKAVEVGQNIEVEVPRSALRNGTNTLRVRVQTPRSPIASDYSKDRRKLGILLKFRWES